MPIGLQRLKYFHEVAAQGSISAAARALGIAQPALSYQMQAIERELGTAVFERSNRGVALTAAGALLYRRADRLIEELDDIEREVRSNAHVAHGTVRLALAVTMARMMVPEILAIAGARLPQVDVKIADVASVPAVAMMQSGQADLALAPNAAEMEDCLIEPLYRERLCLIAARGEGDGDDGRPIALRDIGERPLVLSARQFDLRRRVEEAAIEAGARLNVRYEQDSQETIRSIVTAGLAATISQAAQFHPVTERPRLSIRPIVEPEIARTHSIVRRDARRPTSATLAIAGVVREATANLVAGGVFPGRLLGGPSR
ncbi:LysR family transcriptional regulator [Acuticoccus sp.]|uniref:LysR family transcriptional regulator n=1 Tax=Acuticoccus sp. TaxID=1904378 RepID=UPI003B521CA8